MTTIDVLVDLQFGSTGKGALAGYLSMKNDYEVAVSANMPNAGHTAYDAEGNVFIHKVLPSGVFSKNLRMIAVGPGSVFSIDRLAQEWGHLKARLNTSPRLVIHEIAGILSPSHRDLEEKTLGRIASTMQGSGAALCDKIMRNPGVIAADRMFEIQSAVPEAEVVNQWQWLQSFTSAGDALVEGSQGYSLGISSGFYPHCTSRDCTPARVVADVSLPMSWVRSVYGSCRVHPIRVGNTIEGSSGGWYKDQREISFQSLGVVPEKTTVTGRERRIASFSRHQIEEALLMSSPDTIFLNFAQYSYSDTTESTAIIKDVCQKILNRDVPILLGYGPYPTDVIASSPTWEVK